MRMPPETGILRVWRKQTRLEAVGGGLGSEIWVVPILFLFYTLRGGIIDR